MKELDKTIRRKIEIGAMAFGVAMLVVLFSMYSPQMRRIKSLKSSIAVMNEKIAAAESKNQIDSRSDLKNIYSLIRRYGELKKKFDEASNVLPMDSNVSGVMDALLRLAKESNVDFVKLVSGTPVRGKNYDEMPIELMVKSDYIGLMRFMRNLEGSRMLIRLNLFHIESNEERPPSLEADFNLRVCVRDRVKAK